MIAVAIFGACGVCDPFPSVCCPVAVSACFVVCSLPLYHYLRLKLSKYNMSKSSNVLLSSRDPTTLHTSIQQRFVVPNVKPFDFIRIFKTPEAGAVSAFSHVKGESEFLFPSRGKSGLYMVVPSPALPVVENADTLRPWIRGRLTGTLRKLRSDQSDN